MRDSIKSLLGRAVVTARPAYDYDRCIFILAHMRCGSTALSNILCSRPDVSGYGEAHIRYDGRDALGRLVVNQARRGAWRPRAAYLFDKILHSRHDAGATPDFFKARVIFIAREPAAAIRSIRDLYGRLGRNEYGTDMAAADYYIARLDTLLDQWSGFPADRRVALTHDDLMTAPDNTLARISGALRLTPPLLNQYTSAEASRRGGGGDPFTSGQHNRIVATPRKDESARRPIDVPPQTLGTAEDRYANFVDLIGK